MSRDSWLWGLGLSGGLHALVLAALFWRAPVKPAAALPPVALPRPAETFFRVAMRELRGAASGARPLAAAEEPPALQPVRDAPPPAAPRREASARPDQTPPPPPPSEPDETRREEPPQPAPAAIAEAHREDEPSPTAQTNSDPATSGAGSSSAPSDRGSAPGAGSPSPLTVGAATGAGAAAPVGQGTPSGADDATLASVHGRLADAARGCAPAAARRFRLEGSVGVSFCVDLQGAAASVQIRHGSGQPLLDDATRNCVLPAAAPFPEGARGRCYEVPIRFVLPR